MKLQISNRTPTDMISASTTASKARYHTLLLRTVATKVVMEVVTVAMVGPSPVRHPSSKALDQRRTRAMATKPSRTSPSLSRTRTTPARPLKRATETIRRPHSSRPSKPKSSLTKSKVVRTILGRSRAITLRHQTATRTRTKATGLAITTLEAVGLLRMITMATTVDGRLRTITPAATMVDGPIITTPATVAVDGRATTRSTTVRVGPLRITILANGAPTTTLATARDGPRPTTTDGAALATTTTPPITTDGDLATPAVADRAADGRLLAITSLLAGRRVTTTRRDGETRVQPRAREVREDGRLGRRLEPGVFWKMALLQIGVEEYFLDGVQISAAIMCDVGWNVLGCYGYMVCEI